MERDALLSEIKRVVTEVEPGEVLSAIVRNRQEWDRQPLKGTPFHRSVEIEGVVL